MARAVQNAATSRQNAAAYTALAWAALRGRCFSDVMSMRALVTSDVKRHAFSLTAPVQMRDQERCGGLLARSGKGCAAGKCEWKCGSWSLRRAAHFSGGDNPARAPLRGNSGRASRVSDPRGIVSASGALTADTVPAAGDSADDGTHRVLVMCSCCGFATLGGLLPATARVHRIQSACSDGSNDGRRGDGGAVPHRAASVTRASRSTAADAPAARPFWLLPTRLGGRTASCSQTALPPPPPRVRHASPPPTGLGRPPAHLATTSSGAQAANGIGLHSFSAWS